MKFQLKTYRDLVLGLLLLASAGKSSVPGETRKILGLTSVNLIAYCYQPASGLHSIYTINTDGTDNKRITNSSIGLNHHNWSPDGRRLACVGYINMSTTWSIHVVNEDGSGLVRLTTTSNVWDSEPVWSPDGTQIAFTRVYPFEGSRCELWIMDANGSNQHYIGLPGFGAKWSPDGTRFVYSTGLPGVDAEIFTCQINGTDVRQLTDTAGGSYNPAWSPDGSKIVFVSDRAGPNADIYTMKWDGSEVTRLTSTTSQHYGPKFSPDGSLLAFIADVSASQHWEVYIMNADGADVRRVTTTAGANTSINPDWRPPVRVKGAYLGQILPGASPRLFGFGLIPGGLHTPPYFTPDGKEVYWKRMGDSLIATMKRTGEAWSPPRDTSMFSVPANCADPSISPDGTKLFFTSTGTLPGMSPPPKENIWCAERTDSGWAEPYALDTAINSLALHWLTSTDRQGNLYFGGNTTGVPGEISICCSRYIGGKYQTPERLGDSINAAALQFSPYISPDGDYLIYDRADLQGNGVHMRISFRKPDGSWTTSQVLYSYDMGAPHAAHVTADGKYMFFICWYGSDWETYWVDAHQILDSIPQAPGTFRASSDYRTPHSVHLEWSDPLRCVNGRPVSDLRLHLYRNSAFIAEIDSGVQVFTDSGLAAHQLCIYSLRAVIMDDSSTIVSAAAYAGGHATAMPPTSFAVRDSGTGIVLEWKNPSRQLDGTALNDLAFVLMYRDGVLSDSMVQTSADTGQVRSYLDTARGYHTYRIRVRDDELPANYSTLSDSLLGYGGIPDTSYYEDFEHGRGAIYRIGPWDTTGAVVYRGSHSLTESPSGNSPSGATVYFFTPPVLPDSGFTLVFHDIAIVRSSDTAFIDVSRDGRQTFSVLKRYNSSAYPPWQDGVADPGDWRREAVDLSPYAGDTVTVRFRLATRTGPTSEGWYIDNLRLGHEWAVMDTVSFPWKSRWNMVSLPVQPDGSLRDSLFPSAVAGALFYDPDSGKYLTLGTLENGKGYWLKFPSDGSAQIAGQAVLFDTIEVQQGWNMVGSISEAVPVELITSMTPGMSTSGFYTYSSGYAISDTIRPGRGYWVKTDRRGELILSTTSGGACRIKIVPGGGLPPAPPGSPGAPMSGPEKFALGQNYPNPFNPATAIRFDIPTASPTRLEVYNVLGTLVRALLSGTMEPGSYSVVWDGRDDGGRTVASGLYLYRLSSGGVSRTGKAVLLK